MITFVRWIVAWRSKTQSTQPNLHWYLNQNFQHNNVYDKYFGGVNDVAIYIYIYSFIVFILSLHTMVYQVCVYESLCPRIPAIVLGLFLKKCLIRTASNLKATYK